MSLSLRKRTVHFYEIHVDAYAKAGVQNPSCAALPDLLNCFAGLATSNKLPQTIRKSSHLHTVLSDWHYERSNNCYQLLISKANAALSDVALRDLRTKKLRMAGKTKGNPPNRPKAREVEFSKKEVLREEVKIYRQPDHGCIEAC